MKQQPLMNTPKTKAEQEQFWSFWDNQIKLEYPTLPERIRQAFATELVRQRISGWNDAQHDKTIIGYHV